ncbi:MAG: hypothetical protein IJR14_00595 [Synergistaceae bacterium]|nr:hypothetical protein [Synergistaceae bacterium]
MAMRDGAGQLDLFGAPDVRADAGAPCGAAPSPCRVEPPSPEALRAHLPEALRGEEEAVVERYVTLLHFLVRGIEKRERLAAEGKGEARERARRTLAKLLETRTIELSEKEDALLDRLEALGVVRTLDLKTKTKEEAMKRKIAPLLSLDEARAVLEAYRGVYPRPFRHHVAPEPFPLLDGIVERRRRAESVLRPHDATATPEWAFHVPSWFNDALDIRPVTRMLNLVEYAAWTQGANFAFKAGDMLYRDEASCRAGRAALQVVSAEAARGVAGEALSLGADAAMEPASGEREGERYRPGRVDWRDFETGETRTDTQMAFVRMLIGDRRRRV